MAKPKQNIRQGDGLGAGMGFRGGAGKPGYPVPDILRQKVDGILEDLVTNVIPPDDLRKSGVVPGLVPAGDPLDLVIKKAVKDMLGEAATESLAKTLNNAKELIARHGIKIGLRVGMGANGIAYDIGGGKILKVTEDDSEATASFNLVGKKLKHVVHIDEVFELPEVPGAGKYYGIVQEKLHPLSAEERAGLNKVYNLVEELLVWNWDEHTREQNKKELLQVRQDNPEKAEDVDYLLNSKLFWGLFDIFEELKKYHIVWSDSSPDNLMKRGDTLVAIDLGVSQSPDATIPPLKKEASEKMSGSMEGMNSNQREVVSNADGLINDFRKLFAREHITFDQNPKVAGAGSMAAAFETKEGKILKITQDPTDAGAMAKLVGKNKKHIVEVFRVFKLPTEKHYWGILTEKLKPIPGNGPTWESVTGDAKRLREAMRYSSFLDFRGGSWKDAVKLMQDRTKHKVENAPAAKAAEIQKLAYDSFDVLREFQIPQMVDDVHSLGIKMHDWHPGNIMIKANGDYAVVDMGYSNVPSAGIPTLESLVSRAQNTLREAKLDQVGVTLGRFQPFHRGHAAVVRDLTKKFDRVIIFVAGNNGDKKNPFSYQTREDMIKRSLPDVVSKIEIRPATFQGKSSGYLPGILSDVVKTGESSLKPDTAFQVVVGQDRVAEIKAQFERAKTAQEAGTELPFDPSAVTVGSIANVKNDDDAGRISGTQVRDVIAKGDKESFKKLVDPHLVSNPSDLEKIFGSLKKEMEPGKVESVVEEVLRELLSDIGDEPGVKAILQKYSQQLLNSKWKINVGALHRLGSGQEGIAYDIGNGKVLKVTADAREARTSAKLINRNLQHVVRVFDVFVFGKEEAPQKSFDQRTTKEPGKPGQATAYGIVTEKLTPLTDAEQKEFDSIIDELQAQMGKQRCIDAMWTGDWDHLVDEMKKAFTDDIQKEGGIGPDHPRFQRVLNQRIEKYTGAFKKFGIPEMMTDLKSIGVKFADYHGGNLMKRSGKFVINDLGRSDSGATGTPLRALENVIRSVIDEFAAFTGPGTTGIGLKAGSSAVSTFKNRVDANSKELWQNQLSRIQSPGSGSLPEDG